MKRLILMRHAKTEPWTTGGDDHARALTKTGHMAATGVAEKLRAAGWRPDIALVSTARRARETWTRVSSVFQGCELALIETLYLADARDIRAHVETYRDAETILVIGHNPGLHDLGISLLHEWGYANKEHAMRLIRKLPTGAAIVFEALSDEDSKPDQLPMVGFIRPKDLIEEAEPNPL